MTFTLTDCRVTGAHNWYEARDFTACRGCGAIQRQEALAVLGQPLAPVAVRAAAAVAAAADRLGLDVDSGGAAVIASAVLSLVVIDAAAVAPDCTCELWGWCARCRPGKIARRMCVEHDRPAERCARLARDAFGTAMFSNCEVV